MDNQRVLFDYKTCSKCGKEKPLEEFSRQAQGKYGRRADCKSCVATWQREHKGAHTGTHGLKDRIATIRREREGPFDGFDVSCLREKIGRSEHNAISIYQEV